jgi:hypothetical protein
MNTDNRDGWVLIKPDDYLAIPASQFAAIINAAKNIKHEWSRSSSDAYRVSTAPMSMVFMTGEQMTAMLVRDRITQASEPDQ